MTQKKTTPSKAKKKAASKKKKTTTKKAAAKHEQGVRRPDIPWDKIELDYRAGILKPSTIARKYDVHVTTLDKRAKKFGWAPDLKGTIAKLGLQASVQKTLDAQQAEAKVAAATEKAGAVTDAAEQYAEIVALVLQRHQDSIKRARSTSDKLHQRIVDLFDESDLALAEEVAEMKMRHDAWKKQVAGLIAAGKKKKKDLPPEPEPPPSRLQLVKIRFGITGTAAKVLEQLSRADKTYIDLERRAFGLDDKGEDEDALTYDELVKELNERERAKANS